MKQLPLFLTIKPYTRLAWLVEGSSPGVSYVVDLEGFERQKAVCTCPDFIEGKNKYCKHIRGLVTQL